MHHAGSPVASRKPKSERKSRKVEFMVTEDWYSTFEVEAKSWGLDLSAYVRVACEEKRRRDHGEKADE